MSTEVKFTISSHIKYHQETYKVLVPTLLKTGIPPEDIYFFIGGAEEYTQLEDSNGLRTYTVPHNSIDFTGLVSVVELDLISDYWFLLHDTCYVGPSFYKTVVNTQYTADTIALTSYGHSMNMGAYSWKYLQRNKAKVLSYKNNNSADLQKFKHRLVHEEDSLLTHEISFSKAEKEDLGVDTFYKGVPRRITHFPEIDLYKLQANWFTKEQYTLDI